MDLDMNEINITVNAALKRVGLEPTIDNRVEALAEFSKKFVADEKFPIEQRVRVGLDIAVEIVRLRVEKKMFGL